MELRLNEREMTGHEKALSETSVQRKNGAYYTPTALAQILVDWAIAGQLGRVLDPSCGKGAFAEVAIETLSRLGTPRPGQYVYGVDIDKACGEHFQKNVSLRDCHFLNRDFLSIDSSRMAGVPFRAVVGNPPYVRHHWLRGEALEYARLAAQSFSVNLPRRSSTWAYFILHAIKFLEDDGRLAMVIPEALLQTDYGKVVQCALKKRFSTTHLIRVQERLFKKTDEVALILAATGRGPGNLFVDDVYKIENLLDILQNSPTAASQVEVADNYRRSYNQECFELLQELLQREKFKKLGELARIRIGIVTGANDFFVFRPREANISGIDKVCFMPIVTRTSWLQGIEFQKDDRINLTRASGRSLLCVPKNGCISKDPIKRWLRIGESKGIPERYKCRTREPWYETPVTEIPDAFVTCSRAGLPRLVLNTGRVLATNALNTVNWKGKVNSKSVAVGFLTTISAAYAELHGRWYGGGVLKIEPGTLKNIPVPLTVVPDKKFKKIEDLLREGDESGARILADRIVLVEGLGFTSAEIGKLRGALSSLSAMRVPTRRG